MSLVCPCHVKSVHVKSVLVKSSSVWIVFGFWISLLSINCTWVLTTLTFSGLFTEYTTFTMDPAVSLIRLRQGNRAIKDYVVEFCELCDQVGFNDIDLKDIFCFGLTRKISEKWLQESHFSWCLPI